MINRDILSKQTRDNPLRFLRSILEHQPPRGFGDEEEADGDDDGKDELEAEGETPLEGPALEVKAVVHPVGEAEGGGVAQGADNDELSADAWL